jgi:hypothetical protein
LAATFQAFKTLNAGRTGGNKAPAEELRQLLRKHFGFTARCLLQTNLAPDKIKITPKHYRPIWNIAM